MKFLHTADWQMGMKAESLRNKAAERVRQARLNAAQRVIQVAKKNEAEMILFAGDMFEDNAVDRSLVRQTGEILKSFGKPVFIIPGNRDPLVPGSVWEHPVWKESKNLHVVQTAKAIERENCILFLCPIKEKHSTKNPMAWIDARQESEKICIALAHYQARYNANSQTNLNKESGLANLGRSYLPAKRKPPRNESRRLLFLSLTNRIGRLFLLSRSFFQHSLDFL